MIGCGAVATGDETLLAINVPRRDVLLRRDPLGHRNVERISSRIKTMPRGRPTRSPPPAGYLWEVDAARTIGRCQHTLRRWRRDDLAPPHIKIGPNTAYATADLEAWLESLKVPMARPNGGPEWFVFAHTGRIAA
jgi:hypothetical protein